MSVRDQCTQVSWGISTVLVDETLYISHNLCIAVVSPVSYGLETNTVLLVGHGWLRVQDEWDCQQPLDGVSLKVLQFKQQQTLP